MRFPRALRVLVVAGIAAAPACTCSKPAAVEDAGDGASEDAAVATADSGEPGGLSAPIAATHTDAGDIVVAGLDVAAKAIRVQRLGLDGEVKLERTVWTDLKWSSEADVRVVPAAKGVAITWHGLAKGKLVRELVMLAADLTPLGAPVSVTSSSCATMDALWSTDGKRATARPWGDGGTTRTTIPREGDVSLACGAHRAFAIIDEDDGTRVLVLGEKKKDLDGGTEGGVDAGAEAGGGMLSMFEEPSFGDDDQHERAEYTVGDDLGVVRVASSGTIAVREIKGPDRTALRKVKTKIPRDADVVAVDASPREIVIVYTEDVADACADAGVTSASTKVSVLRVDRAAETETTFELSPGLCGREVGPFFTGPLGDGVEVAWVERVPIHGNPRAPIAALAHRLVIGSDADAGDGGKPELAPLARIEEPADALVDAGCDGTHCYAVALARRPGMDAMVPGYAKILRYF